MVAHNAIAAVPALGTPNRSLTQELLVNRYLYFIDAAEDPQAFDPTNGSGSIVKLIGYNGKLFWYDPLDSTTAHDGVSTLVTAGGERYKIEGVDFLVRRVLDKDLAAPTGSESIGNAFIIPTAATDEFADHDDEIGIKTARGFEFLIPEVGTLIQVADEDKHYRLNEAGDWVLAFDPQASSIVASMINGGRTHWVVENQTQNAPISAAQGVTFIIGPAPSGAFAGHSGKIATRETPGSGTDYTIYPPQEGWTAFDKDLNITLIYNDGVWGSAAGAVVFFDHKFTQSTGSTSFGSSGNHTYSATTAPVQGASETGYRQDDVTIVHTARRTGALLRIRYRARLAGSLDRIVIALFRGSETNAIAWDVNDFPSGAADGIVHLETVVAAPNTSSQTYKIRILPAASDALTTLDHRLFTLEEFA